VTRLGAVASLLTCAVISCAASPVAAQTAPSFRPKRLTVAGGGVVTSGYRVGDVTATIPRNAPGVPPQFTLLRAESDVARSVGFEARVAFAMTRTLAIEVGGSYATPRLDVTVSADPELVSGATATETIDQYVVDVSGVYQLPFTLGRKARSYAIGGAGYLRQLREGQIQVDDGQTIHVGAGLQYWLRGARVGARPMGLRGEVRYVRRSGGVEFQDRARAYPSLTALAFFGF
jgi:hypothetical protein